MDLASLQAERQRMLAKLRDTAAQVDERISAGRHKIALQGEASRNATGNYSPEDAPLPDPEPSAPGGTQLRVSPVSWTATAAPQTTVAGVDTIRGAAWRTARAAATTRRSPA